MNQIFLPEDDEHTADYLSGEKWIVAFFKFHDSTRIHYRQFYAIDFYDAYDRIMTFSEKTIHKVVWYKEKRKCGSFFDGSEILNLESICTYCNSEFSDIEPIKCNFKRNYLCKSEFCSSGCLREHLLHVHINRKTR